jgi:hypothetical protein
VDGKTYTLDEYGIRKASKYVDSIAQAQFARRLESLGVELEYPDFDFARNGSVSWRVKDISRAACQHYSTNGARSLAIRREFEERNGRPMRDAELTQAMRVTRKAKTAADKAQDARPVWERWSDDLREYRLALPSIKGGPEQDRASFHARTDELTRRLLSPNGLCREDATFSGDTIRPAVARCAMGLGLSVEQCQEFEAEFTERLIPVRTADDPRNAIWTTATIVEAEQKIAKDLARREKAQGPKVSGVCIDKAVRVAGQYLYQERKSGKDGVPNQKIDIWSAFGYWEFAPKKADIFGRFDDVKGQLGGVDTGLPGADGIDYWIMSTKQPFKTYIFGGEWYLHPSIRISPNVAWVSYDNDPDPVKFPGRDKDRIYRITFFWSF